MAAKKSKAKKSAPLGVQSTPKQKRKPPKSAWKPGQSGNPKGRPRVGHALAEAIRDVCDPVELAEIAMEIARSGEDDMVRVHALRFLADNGYIKPDPKREPPAVNISFEIRSFVNQLNVTELAAFEKLIMKALPAGDP